MEILNMKNIVLELNDEIEVRQLISNYIYLTSDDVERDEEGNQCLMDAKELIMDEYDANWIEATAKVSEILHEIRELQAS